MLINKQEIQFNREVLYMAGYYLPLFNNNGLGLGSINRVAGRFQLLMHRMVNLLNTEDADKKHYANQAV